MTHTPRNAIGYCRISDARTRNGDTTVVETVGVDDQERRLREHARRIGWTLGRVLIENDTSAFKRRKVPVPGRDRPEYRVIRPKWRQVIEDLWSGRADGLLALDLDRVARDPRDLEDLIDVTEVRAVPAESVRGTLSLGPGKDPTPARLLVAVANKSSRDTSKRVSEARERQALAGEFGGGVRRYGFEKDGVTIRPAEAGVIADCHRRLLQGVSLRSLAAELRLRGVPTVTGAAWSTSSLRDILVRPRNAGRMVWRGEVVGNAPWEPLVPPEVFDAVVRMLTDPDRPGAQSGRAPRWLGSGLYRCGICAPQVVTVQIGRAGGNSVYKCPGGAHLGRIAGEPIPPEPGAVRVRGVDAYVAAAVVERLGRPDALDLLVKPSSTVDAGALYGQAAAIRKRLDQMAEDEVLGLKTRAQVVAATRKAKVRLAEIDTLLANASAESPLAPLINADDVRAEWIRLPLANKRAVVDELMTVTILGAGRRGPGFDPTTVRIDWRNA